jgi:DDE superfamily endonuclease
VLRWKPKAYNRFLAFFRTDAINLDQLTDLWIKLVLHLFEPVDCLGRLVVVIDGIKVGKEGKKMPAVKSLHQQSSSNSKPEFIMGHSFEAASLLVEGSWTGFSTIPLISRIHEGLVFTNRDKRTLLDKAASLIGRIAKAIECKVVVVADAYYGSSTMMDPLVGGGHALITRAKSNAVGYERASRPKRARRGRPKIYGKRCAIRDLAADRSKFVSALSPHRGEENVNLRYRCVDLLWKPVRRLVRFVIVDHPTRGLIVLMATDIEIEPMEIYLLYSHRFQIEVGFRQSLHVLGSYAYRFWMKSLEPTRRHDGNKHLHHKSDEYRRKVRETMRAYELHVQLGCIAQGLMLHLSINHTAAVWSSFHGWLRTMNPKQPPSELVVSEALRGQLPEFMACLAEDPRTTKLIEDYALPEEQRSIWRVSA